MITLGVNRKTQEVFRLNTERSRVVLISGKRGSGKSYTLAVIAEEVFSQGNAIVLVVDPLGIYWTFVLENDETDALGKSAWQLKPKKLPTRILLPADPVEHYGGRVVEKMRMLGVDFKRFYLNASEISSDGWCAFYEYSINEPSGIVLYRAVSELEKRGDFFRVEDIIEKIQEDTKAQDKTKEALTNRLVHTKELELFSEQYMDPNQFFESSFINVIDLSMFYLSAWGLRNLIVGTILRSLFRRATLERKLNDLDLVKEQRRI